MQIIDTYITGTSELYIYSTLRELSGLVFEGWH